MQTAQIHIPTELWKLPNDAWVPPDHVAAMICCSTSSLAHWRSDGKGPRYRKRGNLIRYQVADIKHWLAGDTSEKK